jgi:RNA polymerase sigma factor (sigma-70 family)
MNPPSLTLNYVDAPDTIGSVFTRLAPEKAKCQPNTGYSNDEIISGLKARDKMVVRYIYKQSFAQARYFVTTNSGTLMDAEDVFQDAIVLIYQNIAKPEFSLSCSFATYLYSICRHLWLQKLNKKSYDYEIIDNVGHDPWDDAIEIEEMVAESDKYRLFQKHFNMLKKDEQKVLKLYINKTSSKEVARIMGFKSDKYAKFRKYLCKEKLKNMIINDEDYQKIYCTAN